MPQNDIAIQTQGLTKDYGSRRTSKGQLIHLRQGFGGQANDNSTPPTSLRLPWSRKLRITGNSQ